MSEVPEKPEQMYQATLRHGQTYYYRNQRFDFNEPVLVDQATYSYLRANAIKSVPLSEDDMPERSEQCYFKFAKVTGIKEVPPEPVELLDDDDLDEVQVSQSAVDRLNTPGILISEDAPTEFEPSARAPGAQKEPPASAPRTRRTRG